MDDVSAAARIPPFPAVDSPNSAADMTRPADALMNADPAQPSRPTQPEERIALIDVLRGLALFGIIAANMRGFAGPMASYFHTDLLWKSTTDFWVQAFVDTFIQGKFITLFAFLFGVGFAVQFARAESRHS
jgi:uncharacterized protein